MGLHLTKNAGYILGFLISGCISALLKDSGMTLEDYMLFKIARTDGPKEKKTLQRVKDEYGHWKDLKISSDLQPGVKTET